MQKLLWSFNITPTVDFSLSESSCLDVQMGFCMETTGMTQGSQGETYSDLGTLEEPEFKDETESMENEQDPEV